MKNKQSKSMSIDRRQVVGGIEFGAAASLIGKPHIARAQAETIRIGFPTPLTGPFGAEARDQVKSAENHRYGSYR
jgi:branched-chain amino acid transport system substrate-binding protein